MKGHIKNKVDYAPFKKALLELGRVLLLAVIPVMVVSIDAKTGSIAPNWQVMYATALIAGLRFADKLLHEYGKATKDAKLTLGLTRF